MFTINCLCRLADINVTLLVLVTNNCVMFCVKCYILWWLICAMSYYRVFVANFRPATGKYETFHVSPFRLLFVVSCLAGRKVATRKHEKVTIWRVFAWRPFAFSPRKHDNTTWHKSATIKCNI